MPKHKVVPFIQYINGVPTTLGLAKVEIKDTLVTATITIPHTQNIKTVEEILEVVTLGISLNYALPIKRRDEDGESL